MCETTINQFWKRLDRKHSWTGNTHLLTDTPLDFGLSTWSKKVISRNHFLKPKFCPMRPSSLENSPTTIWAAFKPWPVLCSKTNPRYEHRICSYQSHPITGWGWQMCLEFAGVIWSGTEETWWIEWCSSKPTLFILRQHALICHVSYPHPLNKWNMSHVCQTPFDLLTQWFTNITPHWRVKVCFGYSAFDFWEILTEDQPTSGLPLRCFSFESQSRYMNFMNLEYLRISSQCQKVQKLSSKKHHHSKIMSSKKNIVKWCRKMP